MPLRDERPVRSRFVVLCQQAFALAVVSAVGLSAAGVVELEIVTPAAPGSAQAVGPVPGAVADAGSLVSASPVKPTVTTVHFGGSAAAVIAGRSDTSQSGTAARRTQRISVVSPTAPATGYATVGVTWKDGQDLSPADLTVSVRTQDDGQWSQWQPMVYDVDHEPDPGTDEAVRAGTDAVVVGDVDEVQVKAVTDDGRVPDGLALAVVDPGTDTASTYEKPAIDTGTLPSATVERDDQDGDPDGDAVLAARKSATKLTAPKPEIYSRAQWGADEKLRDKSSLHYGDIHAGFVHHTVNANDYTRDQVPSILRGIYAYHTKSRGWSDIGYNFLVDRFGRIWEGRYGGVDKPVVGAHTLGYNEHSFAMSAIGNYEEAHPSQAMIDAYGALFAWKLAISGVDASDDHVYVASRYFQAINGHRDAGQTACPGKYLYAKIPEIRKIATRLQHGQPVQTAPGPGTPLKVNLSGADWPDLVVRDADTKHALIVRTAGQVSYDTPVQAATGWSGKDLVAATGDLNGDGWADFVARNTSSGRSRAYFGSSSGVLRGAAQTTERFAGVDQLTGVGDFDGDGRADLVGRRTESRRLVLFPGRGDGSFRKARVLAQDWSGYDLTAGVDDFDGDGHPDLAARSGATLLLVPGAGSGNAVGVSKPTALPGQWDRFDVIAGRGDATGDGLPDLVVRTVKSRTVYLYPGDGEGHLTARVGGFTKYAGQRWLALAGQLRGTRKPDLAAVDGKGVMRVYQNTGRRNVGPVIDTGTVLKGVDQLLNVGDWNGDGRGDIMTLLGDGTLQLRAGRKGNHFADPVTAGDFAKVSLLTAAGDVDGDGHPDLVGTDASGARRVYPGNGRSGFGTDFVAGTTVSGVGQVDLGLWDGDATPDTGVRREDGSLWLTTASGSAPVRLVGGLKRYDAVVGLGDLDGDNRADLVMRAPSTGTLWLLPGRKDGFAPRRLISTGFGGYDLIG